MKMRKRKKHTRTRKKGLDTKSTQRVKYRQTSASISSAGVEPQEVDSEQDYLNTPDELLDLAQLNLIQTPKRGRRTTSDDSLLEFRNDWLYFFQGFWHEIGWPLLQIRARGISTIEEVRSAFEPIKQKDRGQLANCFLRGSPEPSEGKRRRANKNRLSKLRLEVRQMQSDRQELQTTCGYAEYALKEADEQYREAIQMELEEKRRRLQEVTEKLRSAEEESKHLEEITYNQDSYFYCSQLIEFLCKGKCAVKPLPLANSLVGLPQMGWRQSLARSSKTPPDSGYVQYPYGILQAVLRIWKRQSKNPQLTLTELFRAEIPKLRKKDGEARSYLSEGWRDLRMAIDQCLKEAHNDGFMPYAITARFVNHRARTKNHAEQIFDEHERLPT